jgi:hypothetical protein
MYDRRVVLDDLASVGDRLCDTDPHALADGESIEVLHRCLARLEAATTRSTAAFDASRPWEADGARSASAWLARRCGLPSSTARRRVALGRALRHLPRAEAAWWRWPGGPVRGPRGPGASSPCSPWWWHMRPSPGASASWPTGTVLSPGSLVDFLDEAWVERVVFDGPSRVIDVGVTRRLFDGATRRAIQVRDRECFHDLCDEPAEHSQIDHIEPWSAGGATTTDNGRSACATTTGHGIDEGDGRRPSRGWRRPAERTSPAMLRSLDALGRSTDSDAAVPTTLLVDPVG